MNTKSSMDGTIAQNGLSLHELNTYIRFGPDSLHHIQVDTVSVMDHLGWKLLVPTIFCFSWEVCLYCSTSMVSSSHVWVAQSINHIINRYCENCYGYNFIKRSEYKMIKDNQVVDHSKFANVVRAGMEFQISIVIRQKERFKKICPQCGTYNYNKAQCGWIKW